MPLFEYVCNDCGAEFEKIVPSHRTAVKCAKCESAKVEKQLSVFAVAGASSAPDEGCGSCGAPEPGMCRMP
jgi:putative FmdB family regulatory protein